MNSSLDIRLSRRSCLQLAAASALWRAAPLVGEDSTTTANASQFIFQDRRQQSREIFGRVVVEAEDGGLLLQGVDGRLWQVTPDKLQQRAETNSPFAPITSLDLAKQLTKELGTGFRSFMSDQYVLCTNASDAYADWCIRLFERLATAFRAFWKQRGFKTTDPQFPLVAIIFEKQTQFAEFATTDVGPDVATVPGYFSIPTNRIVLRNLAEANQGQQARNAEEIKQRLGNELYNVATMVHEATHQIAFNCGLHTRLADNPLWMTEGMATFFETPDIKSKSGWNAAGKINRPRLLRFKEFLTQRRETGSLETLVKNDARLTNAETAEDAYAESWALTYFLIRKQAAAYVKYLTQIAAKAPLAPATQDQRLAEFTTAFGDLTKLEAEFLRYIKPLRIPVA